MISRSSGKPSAFRLTIDGKTGSVIDTVPNAGGYKVTLFDPYDQFVATGTATDPDGDGLTWQP